MADELISRQGAIEILQKSHKAHANNCREEVLLDRDIRLLKELPAVDAVSRGLFEQIKWERDVAMAQLEEYGIAFGAKKQGDIIVLPCKVGDTVYKLLWSQGGKKRWNFHIAEQRVKNLHDIVDCIEGLNKTVFLTREEAEEALEGREENATD